MTDKLIYQVAVGETPLFYEPCMASVRRYADRIGADYIDQREPILKIAPKDSKRSANALKLTYLPIFEKENAFALLDQYEQIAIIDADIYIRDGSPDLFAQTQGAAFAGAVERDMPLTAQYSEKVRKHSDGQFSGLKDVNWLWDVRGAHYYNMGLMVLDKSLAEYLRGETPQQFIRRPEFERFVNGEGHWKWSTDQTLLNYWLKKDRIPCTDLDWKWNALYGAVQSVTEAYFVHFFLSAKLSQAEIYRAIAKL